MAYFVSQHLPCSLKGMSVKQVMTSTLQVTSTTMGIESRQPSIPAPVKDFRRALVLLSRPGKEERGLIV